MSAPPNGNILGAIFAEEERKMKAQKERYWFRCKIDGFEDTGPRFNQHMLEAHGERRTGTAKQLEKASQGRVGA